MKKFLLLTLCFLILGLTACSQSHPSSRDKSASSTIITSSSTTERTTAYLRQLARLGTHTVRLGNCRLPDAAVRQSAL